MSIHLPSTVRPYSSEAYKMAYDLVYNAQHEEVKGFIRWAKEEQNYTRREVNQFIKDVIAVAEYEPTEQELRRWAFEEKQIKDNQNAQNPS